MPSFRHSFIVELFQDDRALVPSLLRDRLRVGLPHYKSVEVASADFTQNAVEFRADLVLVFHARGKAVYSLIIEVQLGQDEGKLYSWPVYVAVQRSRHRCPASLVVITMEESVSAWAGRAIGEGNPGGVHLLPVVLGPGQIPTDPGPDPEPELALLALLAHAEDEHVARLAASALESLKKVAPDRVKVYYEAISGLVRQACKKGLLEETLMEQLLKKYQHDFKTFYEEGKADGVKEGVLMVLRARGLPLDGQIEQRVLSCKDQRLLERWLRRASVVQSIEELFSEE